MDRFQHFSTQCFSEDVLVWITQEENIASNDCNELSEHRLVHFFK